MAKTVTLRLDDEIYEEFVAKAKQQRRSLGKFIEMAALQYSKESEFTDNEETISIMSDEGLMKRIKQGVRDTKARRGKFVA